MCDKFLFLISINLILLNCVNFESKIIIFKRIFYVIQCYLHNATMMRHAWMMGNEENLPNLNIPTSVQCIYIFFKKDKSNKKKFSWLKIWYIFSKITIYTKDIMMEKKYKLKQKGNFIWYFINLCNKKTRLQ